MHSRSKQLGLLALVTPALVALGACAESNEPVTEMPQFAVVGANECTDPSLAPTYFKVIADGGPVSIQVQAHDQGGGLLSESQFTMDAGDCAVAYFNDADFSTANGPYVTITELSGGPTSFSCTAIQTGELAWMGDCWDVTGNSAMAPVARIKGALATFTTPPPPDYGRMTGGGTVRMLDIDGELVRITHGFTLHCDILLSNNLEINWGGNQWHLEKESLSEVSCTDDPTVNPEPPVAPFDTFESWATGRYNGVWGYPIHFILQDSGEPGGKSDKAMMEIFDPDGNAILSVPFDVIVGGNIQAHYDQPHGSKP